MKKQILTFVVPPEQDGITVKNFLRYSCNVSARLLTQLKRIENGILSNGCHVRSIDILKAGDCITITQPQSLNNAIPIKMPLDVLYEDSDVLAVNKPPFMPVHPVHGHQYDTLANAVAAYAEKKNEQFAFRAVNRLDRDTSGIVLLAKNPYAAAFLPKAVDKVYMALCEGEVSGHGTIDSPIRIKPGHTIQRESGFGGERAVTHYKALRYDCGHTLLSIVLETGRTHQIRVHFSGIGHPLAGDDMYGGSRIYFERQCLHCAEMRFCLPSTKQTVVLNCPPENWFERLERNGKK